MFAGEEAAHNEDQADKVREIWTTEVQEDGWWENGSVKLGQDGP